MMFFIVLCYQVTESVLGMAPADGEGIVLIDDKEKVIYKLMGDVTYITGHMTYHQLSQVTQQWVTINVREIKHNHFLSLQLSEKPSKQITSQHNNVKFRIFILILK